MAFSKAKLYDPERQLLADFFRALSHPARLQIIEQLSLTGPSPVCNLIVHHPISDPAFSDHIRILRTVQFVNFKERYPHIIYAVNGKNLTLAEEYMKAYFASI